VTTQEIEVVLADVDQKITTEIRISHVRGVDHSWRARTYLWRLKSLKRAMFDMLEYNKHEHHNLPSYSRSKKSLRGT
jgi:hypothetical protein